MLAAMFPIALILSVAATRRAVRGAVPERLIGSEDR
jgi:hypothetical protein